jgi:hypothetical protein
VTDANQAAALVHNPNAVVYNPSTVITGNPKQWYNPNMFTLPPAGTLGLEGRDSLRGPGLWNWDYSLMKDFKVGLLGEAGGVQFRAEFFNLLNHPNYALPSGLNVLASNGSVSPTAGQITALVNPNAEREIQFALKIIF